MGTLHFSRRNLPHIQREFSVHFLTFCTRERRELQPLARDIVLASCMREHDTRAHVFAVVVMLNHVHLVLQCLLDSGNGCEYALSEILQAIKGASAHKINRTLHSKGS